MSGLVGIWRSLTVTKRATLIAATVATIAAFTMLARTAYVPKLDLLYAGLDGRSAGEVMAALESLDVMHEVRGDAIFVEAAERDAVRMTLAGQGLPSQGQGGYELLDNLNGFSTTSDMFDATYWRAREGELARTILASPGVRAARVHISRPPAGAFARSPNRPTAAVTVTMARGALDESTSHAIRYLVSSSVSGLMPEQVAVIDSARGVVLSPGETDPIQGASQGVADRERQLEQNVIGLLEARVGTGNARVKVTMDLDMERETITERVFDPNGRVVARKETSEMTEASSGPGAPITVASNLPEGDAASNASAAGKSQRTQTNETITYDMSEIRRERQKMPGAVRRMSVAVLVNQTMGPPRTEGEAAELRTDAELEDLRALVAMAVGLNEERGDTLSIKSMTFQAPDTEGTIAEANPVSSFFAANLMSILQVAILGFVTLVLGLFVIKPLLGSASSQQASADALTDAAIMRNAPALSLNPVSDPVSALREIAAAKSDETASLIKNWLETADDAA